MNEATADGPESTDIIAARMAVQRQQLHSQFVSRPERQEPLPASANGQTAMQPYQPRSMLMRLLVDNPQLIQRLVLLAATTALGARYSSWAVRLVGLFLSVRKLGR